MWFKKIFFFFFLILKYVKNWMEKKSFSQYLLNKE